ncbi:hypothetical protein EZS27_014341 [termite gut metagenome]|uniref:Uncharacterized protein n=1 Tax=termite gut metagenome TaxID=433724 RepID=A0A5J4RUA1_9ZZZZ
MIKKYYKIKESEKNINEYVSCAIIYNPKKLTDKATKLTNEFINRVYYQ